MTKQPLGRIVHLVPGRLRAKIPGLAPDTAATLERRIAELPGVHAVRATARTESLVVTFDPTMLDQSTIARQLHSRRLLTLELIDPDHYSRITKPPSEVAFGVKRIFHEVDVRLGELTEGKWDLRSVVPCVFGVMALRALIANPASLGAAPWYVLAWYAFDSFWKLNDHRAGNQPAAATPSAPEST
jgi:hypothetical protein